MGVRSSSEERERGTGLRRRLALGLAIVGFGLFGAALGVSIAAGGSDSQAEPILRAPTAASQERAETQSRGARTSRKQMPIPVRITIPAIDVDARVIPLGLNRDRTIQVPRNFADAGWFRPGPEPGEQGAAVIVGHLASRSGDGVFIRLRNLRPGGLITIRLQGGSTVRFVARSMIRVPKSRFPTKRVYARTRQPTLRLVTCAGRLNPVTGHHADNYIVFASILK